MYSLEITLRNNPASLTVERKELPDAETLYKTIVDAMQSTAPKVLELTCEKQPEKKIGVLSSEITAVQLADKSGGSAAGKITGFGALLS
jgi:hypothetical protein